MFAQMHKPKLGDSFSFYCSDGCTANIFVVQPSQSFSPNFWEWRAGSWGDGRWSARSSGLGGQRESPVI